MKDRILGKVNVHESQPLKETSEIDGEVELTFSNGETLRVDHVILGTGYVKDIKRLPMLHPSLLGGIETYEGAPILNSGFETNVPGLYFIGYSSVTSFGPLFRFVVGTDAAARRVSSAVARQVAHSR